MILTSSLLPEELLLVKRSEEHLDPITETRSSILLELYPDMYKVTFKEAFFASYILFTNCNISEYSINHE